jgi:hypothetical protein
LSLPMLNPVDELSGAALKRTAASMGMLAAVRFRGH